MTVTDIPAEAHTHGSGAVKGFTGSLTHKLGPLPVYAWGLIGAGIFVGYYVYKKRTSSSGDSATGSAADLLAGGSTDGGSGTGELATTGGSSTGNGGSDSPSLAQWGANVSNWLAGQGATPQDADNAISAYINGQTLTADQETLVNKGLAQFGAPPSGLLPVNGPSSGSDPNALASNFVTTWLNFDNPGGGAGFGLTTAGQIVELTGNEWASLLSQGKSQDYVIGQAGDNVPATPSPNTAAPVTATAPTATQTTRAYQVQQGDTYQSLAQTFYGDAGQASQIEAANNNATLTPGATIQVPLS